MRITWDDLSAGSLDGAGDRAVEVSNVDAWAVAADADEFSGNASTFLLSVHTSLTGMQVAPCPVRGDGGIGCGIMGNEVLRFPSGLPLLGAVLDAVVLDAVVLDAVVLDAVVLDAVVLDAVVLDAVVLDAVVLDAVVLDAVVLDAAVLDAVVLDAVVLDAVVLDAVALDAMEREFTVGTLVNSLRLRGILVLEDFF